MFVRASETGGVSNLIRQNCSNIKKDGKEVGLIRVFKTFLQVGCVSHCKFGIGGLLEACQSNRWTLNVLALH